MSHKFRKPKPISEPRRAVAVAAGGLVLSTESKEKYDALLASYREEYDRQGQTENDLVEELTAAKWLQRRILSMITALLDVTMDLMDKEIKEQFDTIDNTTRTALAFAKQTGQTAALDLMQRYAARHARDYHRALDKLRKIQSERNGNDILQNEPKRSLNPNATLGCGPELVPRHTPLATQLATSHESLATSWSAPRK